MTELRVSPAELRVGDVLIADDGTEGQVLAVYGDDQDTWVDLPDETELHLADPYYRIRRPDTP